MNHAEYRLTIARAGINHPLVKAFRAVIACASSDAHRLAEETTDPREATKELGAARGFRHLDRTLETIAKADPDQLENEVDGHAGNR